MDFQANTLVAEVNATLEQVNAEINRTLGKQRADAERRLDEAQTKVLGEVAALTAYCGARASRSRFIYGQHSAAAQSGVSRVALACFMACTV